MVATLNIIIQGLLGTVHLSHNYVIMVKVKFAKFSQYKVYEKAVYRSQNNTQLSKSGKHRQFTFLSRLYIC